MRWQIENPSLQAKTRLDEPIPTSDQAEFDDRLTPEALAPPQSVLG